MINFLTDVHNHQCLEVITLYLIPSSILDIGWLFLEVSRCLDYKIPNQRSIQPLSKI